MCVLYEGLHWCLFRLIVNYASNMVNNGFFGQFFILVTLLENGHDVDRGFANLYSDFVISDGCFEWAFNSLVIPSRLVFGYTWAQLFHLGHHPKIIRPSRRLHLSFLQNGKALCHLHMIIL